MCWINELMAIKNGRLEAKMTRKCISVLMSFRLTLKILNIQILYYNMFYYTVKSIA